MATTVRRRHRRQPEVLDGAEGNEQLTALTGAVLLIGFAVEGLTVVAVHQLLTLHFFFGMLLVGPVALKICSTVYRFARYYGGAEPYVRKGPPAPLLRLLGPFVIITSVAVLGSGVALAVVGPDQMGLWLLLHKASFVLWFGVMTIHVLAYAWRLPRILLGEPGSRARIAAPGGRFRWLLVGTSLATGLLIALLTIHLATPWVARLSGH
ncbi:MAG TPA: hypothetical protein VMV07_07780 [Streptosporangiaceae bacterium]|nr:hypothetical protein [Streptosporangiaceae bacterium]